MKEINRLQEMVNASPRRLRTTIESDNFTLDNIKKELTQYDKQIKEYQARIKVIRQFETVCATYPQKR